MHEQLQHLARNQILSLISGSVIRYKIHVGVQNRLIHPIPKYYSIKIAGPAEQFQFQPNK